MEGVGLTTTVASVVTGSQLAQSTHSLRSLRMPISLAFLSGRQELLASVFVMVNVRTNVVYVQCGWTAACE